MKSNFDDEQLIKYLLKFICGMPIQCHQIRIVDLYGNKKPSQLFDTTTTVNYVFTQLKKKKTGNGKNVNRGVSGSGGSWKGLDNSKPVYNIKKSVIGFKKTFRFDEGIHVWNMKEYRPTDETLAALRQRRQIRNDDFVVCRITRSSNSVKNFVSRDLDYYVPTQNQENVKSSAQYEFQENQELGQYNPATVIPSDHLSSIWNGNEYYISQVSNATQLPLMISAEEECSVPMVHQETPSVSSNDDIARYHRELDAYAASVLKFNMNPLLDSHVPLPQDEDQCPLFSEDFYIGHTALWG